MWSYFKIEWKHFFRNKKNIAVLTLFTAVVLFYALKVAPAYSPIEKVDREEIEARYETRQAFIDEILARGNDALNELHPVTLDAFMTFMEFNELDKSRLEHYDADDLAKYAEVTSTWYMKSAFLNSGRTDYFSFNPLYYTENNPFVNEDAFYISLENWKRYEEFAKANYPLSIELFEQRTALQTLERLLKGPLPLILFIACLLLAVDIVTKDRKHPTLLKGLPLADWKKLVVKFFVSWFGTLSLLIPIGLGLVILGIQSGFGSLNVPVSIYDPPTEFGQPGLFETIQLGEFLWKSGFMLLLWFSVIIGVVLLCSVLFRLEFLNLLVILLLVFAENFYKSRGVGFFWNVEKYPTTYLDVGNVIGGYKNYYYTTASITVEKGMLMVALIGVVLLIISLLITMHKKYRFIR